MIGRTNEGRTNDGRTNDGRTNDSAPKSYGQIILRQQKNLKPDIET